MHTTVSQSHPQLCLHSPAAWATSLPSSRRRRKTLAFPQLKLWSRECIESGKGHAYLKTWRLRRFAVQHRRPAPSYSVGQKVWLSSKDIPLRTTSPKTRTSFHRSFFHQFLIQWEGYGPEERVAERNILDPKLVKDFFKTNPSLDTRGARCRPWGGGYCKDPSLLRFRF